MIDRCYIEITNVCNLNCDFCPKHTRAKRQLTLEEFDLLTERIRGKVIFLYFHLMGEPLLHPLLPDFITMAREKGFRTVLTSNGTLLGRCDELLSALPHKIQLSLHSHESNGKGAVEDYINKVMLFATEAARKGTCMVLRLWNQGGKESENNEIIRLLQQHVPLPWRDRPDGYRMADNLYLEFDRKFQWPDSGKRLEVSGERLEALEVQTDRAIAAPSLRGRAGGEAFCKALRKQIGVLADGSLVPCCLDHNGDVILGNLLQQPLEEILSSPRATAIVEGFDHHYAVEPLCQSCESALIDNSFRGKARKGHHNS